MPVGSLPTTLVVVGVLASVQYIQVTGLPVKRQAGDDMDTDDVLASLYKFGYTQTEEGGVIASMTDPKTAMAEALKLYQKVWGLQASGELDDETLALLATPRCGNPDTQLMLKAQGINKRWTELQGTPFQHFHITYRIDIYSNKFSKDEIDNVVERAFKIWSDASNVLSFGTDKIDPDVKITFVEGDHGDGYNFTGPGGELGHAWPPPTGLLHMDDSETWHNQEGQYHDYNVLFVLVHEIGHILGLGHSNEDDTIMGPWYKQLPPKLLPDDIEGIRALYDSRSPDLFTTTTTTTRPMSAHEMWCKEPRVDAALYTYIDSVGTLLMFRDDEILAYTSGGISEDYPKKIIDHFHNLEYVSSYDAAFRIRVGYQCGTTVCGVSDYYFFKDDMVTLWHLKQQVFKTKISDIFPGIPNNLDGVFLKFVSRKVHIHFIKGNQVYVYEYGRGLLNGYPKPLNELLRGHSQIDAAISYRVRVSGTIIPITFLMEGTQYSAYLYDRQDTPSTANPPYPRPTAPWLFGCKSIPASLTDNDAGLDSKEDLVKLYSWESENAGLSMENDNPEEMLDVDGKPVDPAGAPLKLLDDDDDYAARQIQGNTQPLQAESNVTTSSNNTTTLAPGADSSATGLEMCKWLVAAALLLMVLGDV